MFFLMIDIFVTNLPWLINLIDYGILIIDYYQRVASLWWIFLYLSIC